MKNETADGKTSTSKIGGSATSIVNGDYNENQPNNLLGAGNNGKGEQNSENNNPYRSNFLNRNERLKL